MFMATITIIKIFYEIKVGKLNRKYLTFILKYRNYFTASFYTDLKK